MACALIALLLLLPLLAIVSSGGEQWEHYRLSSDTIPTHYDVLIESDVVSGTFHGEVNITLGVRRDTRAIFLHIFDLLVTSTRVTVGEEGRPIGRSFNHSQHEYFVVEMDDVLIAGEEVILNMRYIGHTGDKLQGLHRVHYVDNGVNRSMLSTKMEPTFARQMLPCFDEPQLKATFTVSVIHPRQYTTVLSNMAIASSSPYTGDRVQTKFERSVKMSTYLLALVVCDFPYIQVEGHKGVILRAYARPSLLEHTRHGLQVAASALEHYGRYFDLPYGRYMDKLDLIAVPQFASGAMENWGLITFRETRLIYDPATSPLRGYISVTKTVCHELVHMWFGNAVTMRWWDDLWLNEGFATFFAYEQGIDQTGDNLNADGLFIGRQMYYGMSYDSYSSTHAIRLAVGHPNEITAVFDSLTYGKGAAVLRMMSAYIGRHNMQVALRAYLRKHQFGNTVTEDLWSALSHASGMDVAWLMRSWTEEEGYPLLVYNTTHIVQRRFAMIPSSSTATLWVIPLRLTCDGRTVTLLMNTTSLYLPPLLGQTCASASVIHLNSNFTGFYRVAYDDYSWNELTRRLFREHTAFSVQDRMSIVQDACELMKAGELSSTKVIALLEGFARVGVLYNKYQPFTQNERSHLVWREIFRILSFLNRQITLDGNAARAQRRMYRWQLSLMNEVLHEVGLDQSIDGESYNSRTIVGGAFSLNETQAVRRMTNMYEQWRANNSYWIHPDYRAMVMRSAILHGKAEERAILHGKAEERATMIDDVYDRYVHTEDADTRGVMRSALACINDKDIIHRLLDRALLDKKEDWGSLAAVMASRSAARMAVFEYYEKNYATLLKTFGLNDRHFGRLVQSVTANLYTEGHLGRLLRLFGQNPNAGAGKRNRRAAVERIKTRINWHKLHLREMIRYIEAHFSD